jgi:hypothetical protein
MASLPKDILDAFHELYNEIQAFKVNSASEMSQKMQENPEALVEILEYASSVEDSTTLTQILVEMLRIFDLENVDIFMLPRVALYCGSIVEMGANPEAGLDKLFNNFKALLPRALKVVSLLKQHSVEYQEALAVPNEILDKLLQITQLITLDDVKAWKLLKFAVLPLMAILARSKSCRDVIRQDDLFITALNTMVKLEGQKTSLRSSTYYVKSILEVAEGFEVTVLHPTLKHGCVVEPCGVQNCFQFFSLLQDALSDKQWGQKINVPRESIDKTVAIAKGEDEISNEGFYDANQWEYYHWTLLHPNNKPLPIDGHLRLQDLMKISFGAGTPEVSVVVLNELETVGKWNANLFCPIHPALRSSVKVKKFLSSQEVQEIVSQIKTYSGTPVEPKPAMTAEQLMAEARIELARKGSLLMVDLMKQKYPECEIDYDEESERIIVGMKDITVALTVISITGAPKGSFIFHKWEIFLTPEDEEGIQMFSMCMGETPEKALLRGGREWLDGTFHTVFKALVLPDTKWEGQLATTRTDSSLIKSWEMYGGDFQIIALDEGFKHATVSEEHEQIFLKALDESNPAGIFLQPLLDFLNESDDDLNLAWVKVYLAKTKDGEFNGEIVINNGHVTDGEQILKSKFKWPEEIPIEGLLSFRKFYVLKVVGTSNK